MKPNTRGGARRGAGRKPTGKVLYSVRMLPEVMEELRRRAAQRSETVGEYLEHVTLVSDYD